LYLCYFMAGINKLGHMQRKTTNILTTMKMEKESQRCIFLKISAKPHFSHLQSRTSHLTSLTLQKSQILPTL